MSCNEADTIVKRDLRRALWSVQAANDVVSEVEKAVEQYSRGVGHLCQKLPLPGKGSCSPRDIHMIHGCRGCSREPMLHQLAGCYVLGVEPCYPSI